MNDSGAELNLLTNYIYISLDTFHSVVQNINSNLDAWLTFLSTDDPAKIIQLIEAYPEFQEYYHDIAMFRKNPRELINMFSEALLQMDKNTANYMIEEQAKLIAITTAERDTAIAERNAAIAEKDAAIAEKDATIAEKDAYIHELEAKLAQSQKFS